MAGYFYAYASEATARAARPDWFGQDGQGGYVLRAPRVVASTRGLWLVEPGLSDPDENGEQTIITPGERSADFVVLSPERDGTEARLIDPPSHQGFA